MIKGDSNTHPNTARLHFHVPPLTVLYYTKEHKLEEHVPLLLGKRSRAVHTKRGELENMSLVNLELM